MRVVKNKILAILLVISLAANLYFVLEEPSKKDLLELRNMTTRLQTANVELSKQVERDNLSIQNYASQLELYRQRIASLESRFNSSPTSLEGTAELQAPSVVQRVEYTVDYPFVTQQVIEEGSMINISVEIRPGKGRVLIHKTPNGHGFSGCCEHSGLRSPE